jgi:hypothetical protein
MNKTGLQESRAWWFMTVIPTLRRLRKEDRKLKVSLGYIVSSRPT